MKENLDSLKTEIPAELSRRGLLLFHGYSRDMETGPEVRWDTHRYPDFHPFLDVAQQLGVKLLVMHHNELDGELIEEAIDELPATAVDFEDQKAYERRLRELSVYEGFTAEVELSFDHNGIRYVFSLEAPWFQELSSILEELDMSLGPGADEDEDEDSYGGYYSRN